MKILYILYPLLFIFLLLAGYPQIQINDVVIDNKNNVNTVITDPLYLYTDKIEKYNKVIKTNSKDAIAYYNRGIVKANLVSDRKTLEKYKEAIEDLNIAKNLDKSLTRRVSNIIEAINKDVLVIFNDSQFNTTTNSNVDWSLLVSFVALIVAFVGTLYAVKHGDAQYNDLMCIQQPYIAIQGIKPSVKDNIIVEYKLDYINSGTHPAKNLSYSFIFINTSKCNDDIQININTKVEIRYNSIVNEIPKDSFSHFVLKPSNMISPYQLYFILCLDYRDAINNTLYKKTFYTYVDNYEEDGKFASRLLHITPKSKNILYQELKEELKEDSNYSKLEFKDDLSEIYLK